MPTLDWRRINRAVLARQMLLQRSALPLHRVVERMAGVQAQYAPSAYVGLSARMEGFTRETLEAALARRSVIQATLMRGTIHLVSRADYWSMAAGIRSRMREWWLQVQRSGATEKAMEALAGRLTAMLSDGPRKRRDLVAALGIDSALWGGVAFWVEMVRVPPSGTWDSRRADLYGLASKWVGPDNAGHAVGVDRLIRRYLGGFGPASRDDIKAFTLLGFTEIDASLDRLALRHFTDEAGGALFDIRSSPIPESDIPTPVRFLGTWDAILLTHARRSLVLPEEYRPSIFHTKAPHSFNTVLVDGQVRGIWKETGGRIELEPFQPIPRRFRDELDEEKMRLEKLYE